MIKKNIAAISITFLILLITAGCSSNKNLGTESAATEESVVEEAEVEEFYYIDSGDTAFSINKNGEKAGEFHEDKIKEILGLDDKGDYVNILTCSDKIVICVCYNSEVEEYRLYAVNESLGKSTELKNIPEPNYNVDYYKGNFYFTYDDKELICSIDDSLEYVVKEADLGALFDKVGNKTIISRRHNGSITCLLNEVGYIITYGSSRDGYEMLKKDGTVAELPQIDKQKSVLFYDNTGIVYKEDHAYYDDDSEKVYCIKLDTMEENEIPESRFERTFCTMKNGKLYWSILSEQDKNADILYEKFYYAYDVESNTDSVLAKIDVTPESKYDIAFYGNEDITYDGGLCICGDSIFIMDVAGDKEKWFRIDKEGDNTSLADLDLAIKTIIPQSFDTAAYTWDKPILVLDHNLFCPIDRGRVGLYSEIILSDEERNKYPEFAKYIEGFNAKFKGEVYGYLERHGEMAEDGKHCIGRLDTMSLNASFSRIYEHFATIVINEYSEGGPHPNYGSRIFNVNLETGKELELSQILNDDSRLIEAVKEHADEGINILDYLTEKYNDSKQDISFDEFLTNTYTDVIQNGNYDYCLTEDGLLFSFDDYDIAPHGYAAVGDIILKYSDYPELVKKEYVVTETKNPDDFVNHKEVNETIVTW